MSDEPVKNPSNLIHILRLQIQPNIVLIPSRSEPFLLSAIEGEIPFAAKCTLERRPSSEYQFKAGKARLLSIKMDVPDMNLYLNSLMHLDSNIQSVGAAGCIISWITRIASRQSSPISIESVKHFSLRDFMHLTSDTFRALCIFEDELHPNSHK